MMIESLGLENFYLFIYFLQIVGWHANNQNLDVVLQAMLLFWENRKQIEGGLYCVQLQMFGSRILQDAKSILSKSIFFQTVSKQIN